MKYAGVRKRRGGNIMHKSLLLLAVVATFVPGPARAADHLASPADVRESLASAAQARGRDLSRLDAFLARPEAGRAASLLGADPSRVRAGLATLKDGELR